MAGWMLTDNVNNRGIGVEHYPGRQKGCLTLINGNEHTVIATFRNKQSEEMFKNIITEMLGSIIHNN